MTKKISVEYLDLMVNAGHLTPEGKEAILQAQMGEARAKFYRVKVTPERLAKLVEDNPDLDFESLYEARTKPKK